jgi:hypothetical protein
MKDNDPQGIKIIETKEWITQVRELSSNSESYKPVLIPEILIKNDEEDKMKDYVSWDPSANVITLSYMKQLNFFYPDITEELIVKYFEFLDDLV